MLAASVLTEVVSPVVDMNDSDGFGQFLHQAKLQLAKTLSRDRESIPLFLLWCFRFDVSRNQGRDVIDPAPRRHFIRLC